MCTFAGSDACVQTHGVHTYTWFLLRLAVFFFMAVRDATRFFMLQWPSSIQCDINGYLAFYLTPDP